MKKRFNADPRDGYYEITPECARGLLSMSKGNRALRTSKLEAYVADIKGRNWKINGEPIILNGADESLLDGHHRCTAVNTAGISIITYVIYARESHFETLDTGAHRNSSDTLHISGINDSNNFSAICTMLYLYQNASGNSHLLKASPHPTPAIITEFGLDYQDEIGEALKAVRSAKKDSKLISIGWFGVLYLLTARTYGDHIAASMCDAVCTGIGLQEGDPILAFRNKLIMSAGSREKLHPHEKLALGIKAVIALMTGRKVSRLQFADSESFPRFPILKNTAVAV